MKTDKKEVLILVHGTFASDDNDEGNSWWQRNSTFSNALLARLGSQYTLIQQTYHWSGENSESERLYAGLKLLSLFEQFEKEQTNYHVIGHSHGGSVIWHALQIKSHLAYLHKEKKVLPHLKSWCSVGTPFIRYERSSSYTSTNAIQSNSLLLMVVVMVVAYFNPLTIWLVLIVVLFLVSLLFAYLTMLSIIEGGNLETENQLQNLSANLFCSRWLGIWSSEDEIINGLQVSIALEDDGIEILPRLKSNTDVYLTDRLLFIPKSLTKKVQALYNKYIAPKVDLFVLQVINKGLHGSHRLGVRAEGIINCPIPDLCDLHPLSQEVSIELTAVANEGIYDMADEIRKLLSSRKQTMTSEYITSQAGDILIHSSYFKSKKVNELIAIHILYSSNNSPTQIEQVALDEWYLSQKAAVQKKLNDKSPLELYVELENEVRAASPRLIPGSWAISDLKKVATRTESLYKFIQS